MLVGDRVRHARYGTGIIIYKDDYAQYLVEFDRSYPEFHSGSGIGKRNHCWWCLKSQLKIEPPKASIKFYLLNRKGA